MNKRRNIHNTRLFELSKENTHIYLIFTYACHLLLDPWSRSQRRNPESKKYAQHARMINDLDNPPVSSKVSRLRLGWPNGHFATSISLWISVHQ